MRSSKNKKLAMAKSDKYFSRYIRLRGANSRGLVQCITCGNWKHWKDIDCGHFRKRRHQATRYDEKNCHSQCRHCNKFKGGKDFEFGQAIDKKYGAGTAVKLHEKSLMTCQRKKWHFEEIAKEYKQKSEELARQKGIQI